MSLSLVYSRASTGMSAPLVTVEVHISRGLAKFNIVGLAEAAVKESRDRVRSAIINSQFEFPARRITVNLAPADLPKEGTRFDLPVALGILAALKFIPPDALQPYEFTGELALSGELRPVRGILPVVLNAIPSGRQLIIPMANCKEAALAENKRVNYANHLLEVCSFLSGKSELPTIALPPSLPCASYSLDLADVKGQRHAKRALEIAAAGRHSLLMLGPPGTGKTLIASRLPSILPKLTKQQAMDVAVVGSLSQQGFNANDWQKIPFRSPHHTISNIALVGGGRPPRPGEISLAHHGVLFLDELAEFSRQTLESLREPLESKTVSISRAAYQTIFPADFQLIAAMNPCPCGYAGSMDEYCECSAEQIKRYLAKISGPLLDRIDMHIEVGRVSHDMLLQKMDDSEKSSVVRPRVEKARHLQFVRQDCYNSKLSIKALEKQCALPEDAQTLLKQATAKFALSARAYHRVLKLARTIADLEENANIESKHIAESLSYRCLDRARL